MLADVRYGIRVLLRTPGSTTVAVLTLALGIGANAAVFSIVDATLLKPLPFRNPAQLVEVLEIRGEGTPEQSIVRGLNRARVAEWRAQSQLFEAVEAAKPARSMKVGATDTTIQVVQVSTGLFSLLDVTPRLGRGFSPGESNGDPRVLLVSDGLWKRLLGGDAAGIGRQIVLDGKSMTVIGVMPPGAQVSIGRTGRRLDAPLQRSRSQGSHMGVRRRHRASTRRARARERSPRGPSCGGVDPARQA